MSQRKRDKTKVDPLTDAEERQPAEPLKTVPRGKQPNATNAVIPGTGRVIKGTDGKEAKRVVTT